MKSRFMGSHLKNTALKTNLLIFLLKNDSKLKKTLKNAMQYIKNKKQKQHLTHQA